MAFFQCLSALIKHGSKCIVLYMQPCTGIENHLTMAYIALEYTFRKFFRNSLA